MSAKIKEFRQLRDMTLLQVANKLGVSESTVQRYESGAIANLKYDTIVKLSALFNVSPCELMGWDEPSSSAPVQEQLSDDERKLLDAYHRLDPEDRAEVRGVAKGLLMADKYKGAESLGAMAI